MATVRPACTDTPSHGPDYEAILLVLSQETGIERTRLTPDARLADLDIPSLDMVQAIFELESRFDIEIPVAADRAGPEFVTVGEMVAHVQATIDRMKGVALPTMTTGPAV